MPSERSALLFCPPLAPVTLCAEQPAVIGRQSQCEISLRRDDISRRHAEVRYEAGQYRIRDLGSTNGTFVNGEEVVGSRILTPGDRIELGSCELTFCWIDSDLRDDGHDVAETVINERTPSRNAFMGNLSDIPPFAIMQVLEMGRKSGVLELQTESLRGRIWFCDGRPVHAESEKQAGFDAALSIVLNDSGSFHFDPQHSTDERTIDCSVTELLLEGARLADEEKEA